MDPGYHGQSVMVLTDQRVVYTEYSTIKSELPRSTSRSISREEWTQLTDSRAIQQILRLPKKIGNPGEVDQTVATLIITTNKRVKETSFNYDSKLPGLDTFLKVIQTIDGQMTDKVGHAKG